MSFPDEMSRDRNDDEITGPSAPRFYTAGGSIKNEEAPPESVAPFVAVDFLLRPFPCILREPSISLCFTHTRVNSCSRLKDLTGHWYSAAHIRSKNRGTEPGVDSAFQEEIPKPIDTVYRRPTHGP